VTLDATLPGISTPVLAAGSDSGASSTDNITSVTTPTFTGTATAGADVKLYEGIRLLGTATATGGAWTIASRALAEGVHNVFARATDSMGNSAESAALAVTIDTSAPTATITRAPGQAASSAIDSVTAGVSFTAAFTESVALLAASDLTLGGTSGGTISNVSGSGSHYTITVDHIEQPGTVTVNLNAGAVHDLAGNPAAVAGSSELVAVQFATQTSMVVASSKLAAGITGTATATVIAPAGSTPAGTVVFTLTGPGGPIQQSVVLTGGTAQTSFAALAIGSYSVTALYQPSAGYLGSSDTKLLNVATGPVGQNSTGLYAAAAGTTVTTFAADGGAISTAQPFTPSEAPGGVRVALADVTGDGVPDRIAVNGPGSPAQLRVFDGQTGQLLYALPLFEGFTGGAFVAAGDVNGDGRADIVATPDQGGGPRVTVFNGPDGAVLANFFGIGDPNFRGGARPAVGDLNGDGIDDLVVSAGFGGGPRIAGYDGTSLRPGTEPRHVFNDFFVFEDTLRNGAYVAVGDLNGDGFADIIAGGGPGGGPRVLAVGGQNLIENDAVVPLVNFFAGDSTLRGGVRVAAKEESGNDHTDVVTGSGDTNDLFVFLSSDLQNGTAQPKRSGQLPGILDGVYVG
jgi:large repetitive protein